MMMLAASLVPTKIRILMDLFTKQHEYVTSFTYQHFRIFTNQHVNFPIQLDDATRELVVLTVS